MTRFTKSDIGCYFDGSRGIYIGEEIMGWAGRIGLEMGVVITDVPCHHDTYGLHGRFDTATCPCPGEDDHAQWYSEATDEAEEFLNTLTDDDVAFGPSEQGDWGLWHLCDDDLDCEFCSTL